MDELREKINNIVHKVAEITPITKRFGKINLNDFKSINIGNKKFDGKICFIDGGNNELISTPSFSLQFIRTASIIFRDNKRIKEEINEAYCLAEKKKDYISCTFFNSNDMEEEKGVFEDLIIKENVSVSKAVEYARRICELRTIIKNLEKLEKEDIVVLDGSLEPTFEEDKRTLENLFELSEGKAFISSLVKTNRILTEEGNDLLPLLSQKAPRGKWFLKSEKNGNISFVKLHEKSNHIFRFEVLNRKEHAEPEKYNGIFEALVENSKDPLFMGYPYGLIIADKRAKVSNEELSFLKTKIITKIDFKALKPHLSSIDAHDILDVIS